MRPRRVIPTINGGMSPSKAPHMWRPKPQLVRKHVRNGDVELPKTETESVIAAHSNVRAALAHKMDSLSRDAFLDWAVELVLS